MEELKKNRQVIFIALAALAFVFMAFCPAVDVMGKAKVNGFKYVFDCDGAGFSRFLLLLNLLVPIAIVILSAIEKPEKPCDKQVLALFATGFVLAFITLIAMTKGVSFAWGSWLYVILSAAGAVAAYITSGGKIPEQIKK